MGLEPEIDDPALQRMKLGPDVEPTEAELLKSPHGSGDAAATGGPAAPETGVGAARRMGLKAFLQILGPGLITGASDDDPSGIGTYSQAGAQFGFGVLWTALFTFPLMLAMQELCARIALHTGIGLGLSLRRKFPSWLVGFCILAMVVANTINIGADLGAIAAGGSPGPANFPLHNPAERNSASTSGKSRTAGRWRKYSLFIHASLSRSKTALDLETESNANRRDISSRLIISFCSGGVQPRRARKFASASGSIPCSRYAPTAVAPWRFESR